MIYLYVLIRNTKYQIWTFNFLKAAQSNVSLCLLCKKLLFKIHSVCLIKLLKNVLLNVWKVFEIGKSYISFSCTIKSFVFLSNHQPNIAFLEIKLYIVIYIFFSDLDKTELNCQKNCTTKFLKAVQRATMRFGIVYLNHNIYNITTLSSILKILHDKHQQYQG